MHNVNNKICANIIFIIVDFSRVMDRFSNSILKYMLTCPTPAQNKYKREYDLYNCETKQSAYKYKPKPVKKNF